MDGSMVKKQLTPKADMTKTNNTIITHFETLIFVKYNAHNRQTTT